MSILEKREIEIPLNGGMDDQSSTELQDMSTLRGVTNLRFGNGGELEQRPTYTTVATVTNPSSVGAYDTLGAAGLVESRGEIYALTDSYGVMSTEGAFLAGGGEAVGTTEPYSKEFPYVPTRVSRLTISATSMDNNERGIYAASSCAYGTDVLVTATWVNIAEGSGAVLRLRALDMETGATIAAAQYSDDVAGSIDWSVDACEISTGVVIMACSGNGAPYSIYKYRYIAATKTFIADGLYLANATGIQIRCKVSITSTNFVFAWQGVGSVLIAREVVASSGATVSTHTATHSGDRGIDIVISGSAYGLVSADAANRRIYAETYGAPGSAIVVATGAVNTSVIALTSSGESTSNASQRRGVIFASFYDISAGIQPYIFTVAYCVDFSSSTPVTLLSTSATELKNVMITTRGCEVDGRAFVGTMPAFYESSIAVPESLVVVRFDAGSSVTSEPRLHPVARCCHDIGSQVTTLMTIWIGSLQSAFAIGSIMKISALCDPSPEKYIVNGLNYNQPTTVRLCSVDMTSQPVVTAKSDGVATIAGGWPVQIDGQVCSMVQPTHRPTVILDTSAAGTTSAAQFIKVIAVYSWVDAAGRLHRSAPSVAVSTGAITNKRLDVYVMEMPYNQFNSDSTRPGPSYNVEIYTTVNNGSTYYRAANSTANDDARTAYTSSGGCRLFTNVLIGNSDMPIVYSEGSASQELASEPPPAFQSVTTVGDRMFAIDAEDRSRIWFTKPFSSGYAPEWNGACTLTIGDDGVGISDVGGIPTIFGKRGIWQVFGEGPNALGTGLFAPARRLPHEVACLDPLSVCKTPYGVVFRARQGIVMLGNDLALTNISRQMSNFITSSALDYFSRVVYDDLADELHVLEFENGYTHHVLAMSENKWSQWEQSASKQRWGDAVVLDGRVWFEHEDANGVSSIRRMLAQDESGYHEHAEGWSIETPWLRFDGVTGNMRVRELLIQVKLGSNIDTTGGPIAVTYQQRDGSVETFSFSTADLYAMGTSEGSVANLRCRVSGQRSRQFKVTVTSTPTSVGGSGHAPIAMRVLYGVQPGGERKKSSTQNKGAA